MEMNITYWLLSTAVHAQSNIQDEDTVYYPQCTTVFSCCLASTSLRRQPSLLQRGAKGFSKWRRCVFWGKVGRRVADEEFTSLTVTPKQIFLAGT